MWLYSAVGRCPRGWFFLDRGILESIYIAHLSAQHSTPRVNHGDAIIDTTRQYLHCQGWLVSTHPPFLVSTVKTWGFDILRAGWGSDDSPMSDTALNDGLFFWISYCGLGSSFFTFVLMFFSCAFLGRRYWGLGNIRAIIVYFYWWLVEAKSLRWTNIFFEPDRFFEEPTLALMLTYWLIATSPTCKELKLKISESQQCPNAAIKLRYLHLWAVWLHRDKEIH